VSVAAAGPGTTRPESLRPEVGLATGPLGTNRLDTALAAVLTLVGLVQVTLLPIADAVLGHLFVLGTTLPLAWRRTRPVEACLVSSAFWLVPVHGYPVLGFVVAVLFFFALGAYGRPLGAVALASVWGAATGVVGTLLGPEPPVAAVGSVIAVVGPVVAGLLVAHQRRQTEELRHLADALAVEQQKVREAAAGAERERIAQELHDVVGHEMTLIAIQAEAAAVALRAAPERAAEPVEAIRATAHRTLAEIRAVVGVLGPGEETPGSGAGLEDLAQRAREAGIAAVVEECGTAWGDHAPARLAVHRIVLECLTNAGRHAPGCPVSVTVDWRPDAVTVESSNPLSSGAPAPSPGTGRGLTGMRHRAELLGGTFAAGNRDGRFEVRATLPRSATGTSA
jgi:signal transduction histidine kinase